MSKLFGDYVVFLNQKIGEGAFGQVYQAKFQNQTLACKILQLESINALQMAQLELNIMKSLNHPNLVRCYNFFCDKQNLYIFMEYCKEGNLRKLKFTENLAIQILPQIITGLKALADHHICHRDLKPENILIKDGQIKLADFGLSKISSGLMKTILGTPLYMSPQILQNQAYTQKTDIWSIGVLLFEIIFKNIPFDGKDLYGLLRDIDRKIKSQVIHKKLNDVRLGKLIQQMLQIEESKRISLDELIKNVNLNPISVPLIQVNSVSVSPNKKQDIGHILSIITLFFFMMALVFQNKK